MNATSSEVRSSRKTGLIIAGILSLLVAGFLGFQWIVRQAFHNALVGETGPVSSCANWPRPLKELLDESEDITCDAPDVQVHCLCQAFDPEYVWRMEARPGLLERLVERWELSEVDDPKWYKLEGYKSWISGVRTPPWYSPRDDGHTTFFVSRQVLEHGDSDRFHVAFDKERNTIFVHYWFDF